MIQQGSPLAVRYGNQSVAEQHSLSIALQLLENDSRFSDLWSAIIYSSAASFGNEKSGRTGTLETRKERFRRLVRIAVLATDIADTSLREDRQRRWEQYFLDDTNNNNNVKHDTNPTEDPRVVIAMEHIMQAADVAHTMTIRKSHNHTATSSSDGEKHPYRYWNGRLYREQRQSFDAKSSGDKDGQEDPSIGWYQGEIGFFTFYIIPLAERLEHCCLGSVGDRSLHYGSDIQISSLSKNAKRNRMEWELEGKEAVMTLVRSF